ncbi:MAG: HD domain-containing protein [Acidobacteriota bacterium]|nr:HD domain-containing protein [Acidobacteriota bacterium]
MEHVLRSTLIGLRLSTLLGLDQQERASLYYVSLLACVGCFADAHEQARWFGDDISLKADMYDVDFAGMPMMAFTFGHIGGDESSLSRARKRVAFMGAGRREMAGMYVTHCALAGQLAQHLGLDADVQDALQHAYERWDGRGSPNALAGKRIALSARLTRLARTAEVFHRRGGVEAAIHVVKERRGSEFDPEIVDLFSREAAALLQEVSAIDSWNTVIAEEPGLRSPLSEAELDTVLEALADYVDLKSPHTLGHSRGVADLAAEAGRRHGLPEDGVVTLRRAALIHDLGRLGVSNAIWDKPAPLTASEWERVRLHPYLTHRMLASSRTLSSLAAIAVQHHERLDGSGYPSGLSGGAISPAARLLAAADVYHAATEPRPHRAARSREQAADELRSEVRAGRIDAAAAAAVLAAAGERVGRRPKGPSGLTSREIDVLRLLARGLSNPEIASRLVITRKTASSHVEHIYAKIGVSSRAAASLYAVQQGLLPEEPLAT